MWVIQLYYGSSVPARMGKRWFYIHISWQKNPRPLDVKNPDRIGVFRGYIFFAYPLWCARQDLNPHPLGMGPKPIASAYSATGAHLFFNSFSLWKSKYLIVTPRYRYLNPSRLPIPPRAHIYFSTAYLLWKSKYSIVTQRYRHLNPARLPVPPRAHIYISTAFRCENQSIKLLHRGDVT